MENRAKTNTNKSHADYSQSLNPQDRTVDPTDISNKQQTQAHTHLHRKGIPQKNTSDVDKWPPKNHDDKLNHEDGP